MEVGGLGEGGRHCIIVVETFLQHHRSNNGNGCIDTPSLMRTEATIWATICHSKALGAGCLEEITTIFTILERPMIQLRVDQNFAEKSIKIHL